MTPITSDAPSGDLFITTKEAVLREYVLYLDELDFVLSTLFDVPHPYVALAEMQAHLRDPVYSTKLPVQTTLKTVVDMRKYVLFTLIHT